MVDDVMPHSHEELGRLIIARLRDKAGGVIRRCEVCDQNSWNLEKGLIPLSIALDSKTVALGGTVLPVVAVTCRICGNTHLINLKVLGFTDDQVKAMDFHDAS